MEISTAYFSVSFSNPSQLPHHLTTFIVKTVNAFAQRRHEPWFSDEFGLEYIKPHCPSTSEAQIAR